MVPDWVAVVNKEDAVDFLEAAWNGDSSNRYQSLIKHCNQEIIKAFLTFSNTTEQQTPAATLSPSFSRTAKKPSIKSMRI